MPSLKLSEVQETCLKCRSLKTAVRVTTPSHSWVEDDGPCYTPPKDDVLVECRCGLTVIPYTLFNTTAKEPIEMPEVFDLNSDKSTAVNAVLKAVKNAEIALLNRETEQAAFDMRHNQVLTNTAAALDARLLEAMQNGLTVADIESYLPEYADALKDRVFALQDVVALSNLTELV